MIAYLPFLQPCGLFHTHWWILMVPLVFGIAIAYRATHDATLAGFWGRTGLSTLKSSAAMAILALLMYLFVYVVLPVLPAN